MVINTKVFGRVVNLEKSLGEDGSNMYEREMAEKNLIMKALVGSHLYGTETKDSDKDYVGIFIPDEDYVLGTKRVEQVEIRTNPTDSGRRNTPLDVDTVIYSLPKFIHLAAGNNPNILELLFVPEKNLVFTSKYYEELRNAAHLFVSKKAKHTFCGYAYSQKQKLLYKNFEGGRKATVEKFGFETKFASHIPRLLAEGMQLLIEGRLTFPITNNRLVRDIKIGRHDLNYVLAKSDEMEQSIEDAYIASKVQHTPDVEAINKLQIKLLKEFYGQ